MFATDLQLAKLLDITPAKVRALAAEGVLAETAQGYDLTPSVTAYCRHLHAQLKSAGADSKPQAAGLEQKRLEADIRIKTAKAKQEELKLEALGVEIGARKDEDGEARQFLELAGISDIAYYIGISQPTLSRMVNVTAKDAPAPVSGRKYNTRALIEWYYLRKADRLAPTNAKAKIAEQEYRIKKTRADILAGTVVTVDYAYTLISQIYATCWAALKNNAKRFAPDKVQDAEKAAKADFAECRRALDKLARTDC